MSAFAELLRKLNLDYTVARKTFKMVHIEIMLSLHHSLICKPRNYE